MLLRIRQPAAVNKMCICHPKLCRPRIHLPDKPFLASGYLLCHRHRRIIPGCNDDTFQQRLDCLPLSFLQKNLRPSHRPCVCTRHDLLIQRQLPVRNRLKDQQDRHDFRHARRMQPFIRCLFIQKLSGGQLHQAGMGCLKLRCLRRRLHRYYVSKQQQYCQKAGYPFFHSTRSGLLFLQYIPG